MGNLMVSLRNAADAMEVFQRGMGVVQTNVTNSSTPGYARQTQILSADRMELDIGLSGGVSSGGNLDSRDEMVESNVRSQQNGLSAADARTQQLAQLDQIFGVGQSAGINGAINELMSAFSAATVTPNDSVARQNILSKAGKLGYQVNSAAASLDTMMQNVNTSITSAVGQINAIAAKIVDINKQMANDYRAQGDAGLQAQLHSLLDNLSQYTDFTVLPGSDGSASVFIGGQTPITMGVTQYKLQADTSTTPPRLLDANSKDITGQLQSGGLSALFDIRNNVLPGQMDKLNQLAQGIADTVNLTLAGGVDQNGAVPAQNLFTYDAVTGAARTLGTNTLATTELALASPAAPGGNGVALQLAALATTPSMGSLTFSQYYGNMASDAGRLVSNAKSDQTMQTSLLAQAKQLREDRQSVSLDQEALSLMAFQKSYQASAKMVQTLNEMLDTVINILR